MGNPRIAVAQRWSDTDQLGHGDLLNAAKCLERAEQFISEQ